jgi:hypothetical protein
MSLSDGQINEAVVIGRANMETMEMARRNCVRTRCTSHYVARLRENQCWR